MEATPPERSSDPDLERSQEIEGYRTLLRSAAAVLDGVERALAALGDGTYGDCTVCGMPIPDDRLVSDPTALTCAAHAAS